MKIGTDVSVLAEPGRSDAAVLADHLAVADLEEPLGFDSLFGLEHHFTGYSMSPDPLQLLSYYAAKTKRITLGTCVIVLPWHDPLRVAEQIALLDNMSGGRMILGIGRGLARIEYEGFRVDMNTSRERFVEYAGLILDALETGEMEYDNEFGTQPLQGVRDVIGRQAGRALVKQMIRHACQSRLPGIARAAACAKVGE